MSDFTAIGGVSATIRTLLLDRMEVQDGESNPVIAIAPPDVSSATATGSFLNLFLYRVTENAHLKNQNDPGFDGGYGHPPLSLDLHYLLTAYGQSEEGLHAQHVLGNAMRVLHDYSVITPDLKQVRNNPDQPVLDSSLQNQFERIKIYLDNMTLEDITKIWTALTKPYRLSVAYTVSAVRINAALARRIPRMVSDSASGGIGIQVIPIIRPQIDGFHVRQPGDPPELLRKMPYAGIGDTLIISGQNLGAKDFSVHLGSVDITPQVTKRDNACLEVIVPDDSRLQPGTAALRASADVMMGDPPSRRTGIQSNSAPIMLVPKISSIEPIPAQNPKKLTINGLRLLSPRADSITLLGDVIVDKSSYDESSSSNSISFDMPKLDSGKYQVRVRVNGAENLSEWILEI